MSAFPPNVTSGITTDDTPYKAAWMMLMALAVTFATLWSRTQTIRTFKNMCREEYYQPLLVNEFFTVFFGVKTVDEIDRKGCLPSFRWYWWYWSKPLFCIAMKITFLIITWVFYQERLCDTVNGLAPKCTLITPRDDFAIVLLCITMFNSVLCDCYTIWDQRKKLRDVMGGGPKAVATLSTLTAINAIQNPSSVATSNATYKLAGHFRGVNGTTYGSIKRAIYVTFSLLWPTIPLIGGTFIWWDRPTNTSYTFRMETTQIWLTFFTGVILFVDRMYAFYISSPSLFFLFGLKNDQLVVPSDTLLEVDPNSINDDESSKITYVEASKYYNATKVGFSSDVIGFGRWLKGQIPLHYVSPQFAWAHSFSMFAIGFGIYNDESQATAFYMICGVLPIFLTLFAGARYEYYPMYSNDCMMYFFLFSYFLQGVVYYTTNQIGFNLITLSQSATYPLNQPTVQFGTSIRLVYSLAFAFVVANFLFITTKERPKKLILERKGTDVVSAT